MDQAILIGTKYNPKSLINKIKNEFDYTLNHRGDIVFLDCEKYYGQVSHDRIKNRLATVIAEVIIEDWAHLLIKKIIREHYYFFNEEEKRAIEEKVLDIIKNKLNYYFFYRKENITKKILDYLNKNRELVLDGFVNFRLKDYKLDLEELVDIVVDDFMLEKEYFEFIRLLKYFVDIQEPKVPEVNIILNEKNFKLLNSQGNEIENEYLEGILLESTDSNINYEDLLISALITLAPQKLVIHTEKKDNRQETLKTIENVFGNKVSYCLSCSFCCNKL